VRALAHRLAGDSVTLPDEGALAAFDGATAWLNSEPLSPQALRGKVVLVDFWTYTCVNWLRTLPYVRAWAAKYRDQGLVVVGAHTPEFPFEHDLANVRDSLAWFKVDWPVAQDNDFGVWRAFGNHYWPAVYLADGQGRLRYHHFGEGEYAATEMAIQRLLLDAGATDVDQNLVMVDPQGLEVPADWRSVQSPETYVGYAQASGFANEDPGAFDRPHVYAPFSLGLNEWCVIGDWRMGQHAGTANEAGGKIRFRFHARDLNLVMGPASRGTSLPFRVLLDGQPLGDNHGADVDGDGSGTLNDQRTYQLIRQSGPIIEREAEVEFLGSGAEAYCFTFG
jgi:thiol-disulfide isomerase/thioredoxin